MSTPQSEEITRGVVPADVAAWLELQGWTRVAALGAVAQRWQREDAQVLLPTSGASPDFRLRWNEMLSALSARLDTDPEGVLLSVAKAGSDIAEFRASGDIDDSLPLGDAATLIDSVRRAMQASANSALQPRSYFGHSLPEAAREHARSVRMGQTRRGSYVVPVISRVPILQPDESEDAVLFESVTYQPFVRTAMLKLAQGLSALRELTHEESLPPRSQITSSIAAGVSFELCDSVASSLETHSIANLAVGFSWAERLPIASAPEAVSLDAGAAYLVREVGNVLKGEPIVGRQTIVGYVKRLDRGEEDEVGRITLRALDHDKARNINMDLDDAAYHVAGLANADRRMVSVTGVLHRESGRALRFTEVSDFHLLEGLPSLLD